MDESQLQLSNTLHIQMVDSGYLHRKFIHDPTLKQIHALD